MPSNSIGSGAVSVGADHRARDATAGVLAQLAIYVTERVVFDTPVGIETSRVAESVRIAVYLIDGANAQAARVLATKLLQSRVLIPCEVLSEICSP